MRWLPQNSEVFYAEGPVLHLGQAELERLKAAARANPSGKARLCAHLRDTDTLHEMVIVHHANTYVRPHRHTGKGESFHIMEGAGEVVLFDEAGEVTEVVRLGTLDSGRSCFYRLREPRFHCVIIESGVLVFHETTAGPFVPADTEFAPWSPTGQDAATAGSYLDALKARVQAFLDDTP